MLPSTPPFLFLPPPSPPSKMTLRLQSSKNPQIRPQILHHLLLLLLLFPFHAQSGCKSGCDLALASYYITEGQNLTYISSLFGIDQSSINAVVLPYNNLISRDNIQANTRVNIPFACGCDGEEYLASTFNYTVLQGDTYYKIAREYYKNLTTAEWLEEVNNYPAANIPVGVKIRPSVNCSCGDSDVSGDYGLFVTYPLRAGETLESVAAEVQFDDEDLLQEFNPGVNFSAGSGIVFVPTKDSNGSFRPLSSSKGLSGGAIAGIIIAVVVLLALAAFIYMLCGRKIARKHIASFIPSKIPETVSTFMGHKVDKSVEFSYEELAMATNDFNIANKIGSGGYGDVYYAELRGERTAIKKMAVQSSKQFLAELNVLSNVHHFNLVRLIGYCTEESLFLVYEFVENGNLSQHLRGSGYSSLSWSSRVQIALDSARGLEYIHEHTVPVYIHRDIKSANILLDNSFRAKVADFGLAKLSEVGNTMSKFVGTFGYMPPEYAQLGDVTAKVDVYAFGVVLYELISAKRAIFTMNSSGNESKGLVSLFVEVLSDPGAEEELRKIVDPRLGDDYDIDAVYKMAQLGKACTQEDPRLRPTMRFVVVKLMTLSSDTQDWDVGLFYENQSLESSISNFSGR